MSPMSQERSVRLPLLVVWVLEGFFLLVLFAAMSYFISQYVIDRVGDTTRKQSVAGCDRNQIPRGYLQLRAQEFTEADGGKRSTTTKLAPDYFRIVNCGATFAPDNQGFTVYLSPELAKCFNELLRTRGFGNNAENVTTDPQRLHVEFNCT